jgi:hypothetical protein
VARIEGAGHYPNLERPAEWDAIIDDFLPDLDVVPSTDLRSQRRS